MSKITRRRTTVKLYQGNFEQDLADKQADFEAALSKEETGARRQSTRSKAAALALEHEAMKAEAEATAEVVTLWAVSNAEWSEIADDHPPREGNPVDARNGVNMQTFLPVLLRIAMVDPETPGVTSAADKIALGGVALGTLDPIRAHYMKLETAAWNVTVGDDALPKYSLVSLLKQAREPDSKPQSDSE